MKIFTQNLNSVATKFGHFKDTEGITLVAFITYCRDIADEILGMQTVMTIFYIAANGLTEQLAGKPWKRE